MMIRKSSSEKEESDDGETSGDEKELKYPKEDYTYIPVYAVPNAVTEALVGQSPAPGDYKEDKDIGAKAVKDDWQEYFTSQDRLKYLLLALLALMLVIPIVGRCRRHRRYCPTMRYCCSAFLAMSAVLMLLSLVFAIMAAVQLNKSMKKTVDCHSQSSGGKSSDNDIFGINSEYRRHRLHGTNYNQLSAATQTVIRAEAMRNLSEVLRKMQGAKPLLEELRDELPVAKGLAIRFRDALRAIKQNLKVFLTAQCSQEECGDFYRDNGIRMLDEGCLHYDRLPPTEEFTKSIEKILADIFVNYPLIGAQQIVKAIRNPMDNLVIKKDHYKSANIQQETSNASLIELEVNNNGTLRQDNRKEGGSSSPAAALRGKMGGTWYKNTLGWLLMLLFLPILLLIGLLAILFSCKHARRLLCAFKIIAFILFALNTILLLFFLIHGALAHQIFCAGKSGGSKSGNSFFFLPMLRSGNALQQWVRNESMYEVLVRKELHVKKDVRESAKKLKGAPMHGNLNSTDTVDGELLGDNLFSYNSSHFTHHMCQELVPKPKPGPLPGLISRLDNLTSSLGTPPFLLNQTSYLRAAHKELGQPLAAIVHRLLAKLSHLDHLLSGGYGSLARYTSRLLEKIKLADLSRDAQRVSAEVDVGSGLGNDTTDLYTPQTRLDVSQLKLDMDRSVQFDDFCKRIANPMNAIWFWLLVFSLLLLPALCCSNYLRCRLCLCRCPSQDTLVSCGGENFVAHCTLPTALESHCRSHRYLPMCSERNTCNHISMNHNHSEHYC